MTNPTSSFGWIMPTASDLVTDLPADFEVFGQAVDTDLAGLNGGTTGQVLAKASDTDLDFVWSADAAGMVNPMTTTGDVIYSSSGSTPARLGIGTNGQVLTSDGSIVNWETPSADIPLSTVTTNGDLIYATGSGAVTRRAIGATNDVLTVSGGVPTWAAPAGGGSSYSLISTTRLIGGISSVTFSSLTSYNKLYIDFADISLNAASTIYMRMNGSSTALDYPTSYQMLRGGSTYSYNTIAAGSNTGNTNGIILGYPPAAGPTMSGIVIIDGMKASTPKVVTQILGISPNSATSNAYQGGARFNGAAVSSVEIRIAGTTFSDGYVRLYGSSI